MAVNKVQANPNIYAQQYLRQMQGSVQPTGQQVGGQTTLGFQATNTEFNWRNLDKFDKKIGENKTNGVNLFAQARPVNEAGGSQNLANNNASGLLARLNAMGTGELTPASDAKFQLLA